MSRTSEIVTQQEIQAYVKFCKDYSVVNSDSGDPDTLANANFVLNYFLEIWKQDMTEPNFALAFPQLKSQLKFYSSPQHAEYTHVANENRHLAQQLSNFLVTQGRSGQLVNAGDEAYENLTLLLTELRNRREDVSSTTIRNAIDRISNRPGRKLHYVEAPRRTEPQSRAAREDKSDSTNWLGQDLVKNADGSFRSKTVAEQRREQEAREAANAPPTTRHEPDAWETLCNQLVNYGSRHSQKAAMQETYDLGVQNGKSWREIYVEMNRLKNQYEFSPAPLAPSVKAR